MNIKIQNHLFRLQEFDRDDGDDMYDTPDKSSIQGSRDWDDMYDSPDKPSIQGSGDGDDMYDTPDKPTKLKFRQSDVIGEALCAVIIRDTTARYQISSILSLQWLRVAKLLLCLLKHLIKLVNGLNELN